MTGLQQTLTDFGRHLRDPHHTRRPAGLPARPVAIYGELLFNNLAGCLDACFPVSHQMLGDARWRRLERRHFRDWPSQTPLFREIPQEFLAFLAEHGTTCRLPAWFAELAHYEWAELAVDQMDCPPVAHRSNGDLMQETIVTNPAVMNLAYRWPVHLIGPDYRPRRPQTTCLAVYRDRAEQVQFTLLKPATARLLSLLSAGNLSGRQALLQLAEELGAPEPEQLMALGEEEIHALQRKGLVLGVRE
jgi:hypothetical protein